MDVKLTGTAADLVEKLAKERHQSPEEVIQEALERQLFFSDAVDHGQKVLLEQPDKSIAEVVFDSGKSV
jgi:predicted transcriptional regulator